MTDSNSVGSNRKPGTFVKGDPRCWRKGRPKNFDELRNMVQLIGHEKVAVGPNSEGKIVAVTRIELLVRGMYASKDPRQHQALLDIAYGRVPQAVELTGKEGGELVIVVKPPDVK